MCICLHLTYSDPFCPTKHYLNHYASGIIPRLYGAYCLVSQRSNNCVYQHELCAHINRQAIYIGKRRRKKELFVDSLYIAKLFNTSRMT